jgi:hypothetical protein
VEAKVGENDLGDIALPPSMVIRGQVVSESGHPVAGAVVEAGARVTADGVSLRDSKEILFPWQSQLFGDAMPVITDASGRFEIALSKNRLKKRIAIVADHPYHGRSTVAQLEVRGESSINLKLKPIGSLSGRLTPATTDYDQIKAIDENGLEIATSLDQESGEFRFDRIGPGTYELLVSSLSARKKLGSATVTAGERASIELEFSSRARIEVKVKDCRSERRGFIVLLANKRVKEDTPVEDLLHPEVKMDMAFAMNDCTVILPDVAPATYDVCTWSMAKKSAGSTMKSNGGRCKTIEVGEESAKLTL